MEAGMFTVTREYQFDAAHRLPLHEGKCRNLHGHRYTVVATFHSNALDDKAMVIDYASIDEILKAVVGPCDHATLVDDTDPTLLEFVESEGSRKVVFTDPTTAETLAKTFYKAIQARVKDKRLTPIQGVNLVRIEVRETPRSAAFYEGDI